MWFLSKNSTLLRTVLVLVALIGVIVGPPWLPLLCMILISLRWAAWDVLLIGLLEDFLWMPDTVLQGIPFYTITALILVWGLDPLRREFLFR